MRAWRRVGIATTAAAVVFAAVAPSSAGQTVSTTTTTTPIVGAGPGGGEPRVSAVVHSWALAPAGSTDPSQPGNRPNLSYEVAPGAKIDDAVTLFNYGNVQLTFRVYATDAFNNPDGEFDLLAGDKTPTEVGTWVKVPQANITVPARSQATMPIIVDVPVDARPGDHAGAVLASSQAEGTGPDGKVIAFDRRTGPRLYVRVAGPLAPELSIEKLHTTYHPALNPLGGTAEVSYRIENRGNVRIGGTLRVSVAGPFGVAARRKPGQNLPELLPGEGVSLSATFDGVAATGLASTKVDVDPAPVGGPADPSPVSMRSRMIAVPLTVLALVAAFGLLRLARRSLRRHRPEHARVGPAAP